MPSQLSGCLQQPAATHLRKFSAIILTAVHAHAPASNQKAACHAFGLEKGGWMHASMHASWMARCSHTCRTACQQRHRTRPPFTSHKPAGAPDPIMATRYRGSASRRASRLVTNQSAEALTTGRSTMPEEGQVGEQADKRGWAGLLGCVAGICKPCAASDEQPVHKCWFTSALDTSTETMPRRSTAGIERYPLSLTTKADKHVCAAALLHRFKVGDAVAHHHHLVNNERRSTACTFLRGQRRQCI